MTDSDRIQALTALLEQVIHSLDMTQYQIEDPSYSHAVECEAQEYHDLMVDILSGRLPVLASEEQGR